VTAKDPEKTEKGGKRKDTRWEMLVEIVVMTIIRLQSRKNIKRIAESNHLNVLYCKAKSQVVRIEKRTKEVGAWRLMRKVAADQE